jgi:DNA polymerase III epsilon subunit-like protein
VRYQGKDIKKWLYIEENWAVIQLKARISGRLNISPKDQVLIKVTVEELMDDELLKDHQIVANNRSHLLLLKGSKLSRPYIDVALIGSVVDPVIDHPSDNCKSNQSLPESSANQAPAASSQGQVQPKPVSKYRKPLYCMDTEQVTCRPALQYDGLCDKKGVCVAGHVVIINEKFEVVYNQLVNVALNREVLDYNTCKSGLTPELLMTGKPFAQVRKDVKRLLEGSILVGHSLDADFSALKLSPKEMRVKVRDIGECFKNHFSHYSVNDKPGLKFLAETVAGQKVQTSGKPHTALEDAEATLHVYLRVADEWFP